VPFKAILKKLVEDTPHADGAILADWEGEAVEQHSLHDDYELKLLGAHKGIILSRMKQLHEELSGEELREAIITTASQRIVIGPVGPDYSLVMTLAREGIPGQATYRFREATKLLKKEIY
jgi:predicted regulator of Ras-like GTPase activity (Roadblock/LC7/MglB family)